MASDLKSKPTAKHELFVDQQLARVSKRLHWLEVGKALLLFAVVTLAYALAMAVFDLSLGKDAGDWVRWVRLGCLGAYLATAVFLLGLVAVRFVRRINPYYVARQIEESHPDAKNSVVNWLDLRQARIAPMIRNALGLRAAHDIKATDTEKAVDARGTWVLGGLLGGLLVGFIILFLTSANQFGSLMRRAFLPLGDFTLATRTEIELVTPREGNVTVALQQRVDFRAQIHGRVPRVNTPEAPKVLYRYSQEDSWVPLPLEEDRDGSWAASLQADQVQNGFWYKLTAGDTETETFQVKVRGLAQANRFEITCRFRPYISVQDLTLVFPNEYAVFPRIKAPRGSKITLVVRTNRTLQQARIEMEQGGTRKDLIGEVDREDPRSFRTEFVLDKSGQFRVRFVSKEGEENTDRSPYPLDVVPDLPPNVVLKKPGEDISLPANGTLQVEGAASDDFGIKELALHFKVLEGAERPALKPHAYRPEKPLRFLEGGYPDHLEYKDFVALDQLKTIKGDVVPLTRGMVLEYWLEARDNCDYPDKAGNLGKSATFKINIGDPQDQKKSQGERQKAQDEQKKHDKKQDQDLKNQQEARKQQEQGGNKQQSPEDKKKEDDLKEKANRLQEEIRKDEKAKRDEAQRQKGEAKGDDGPKSEDKQAGGEPPPAQAKDQKEQKGEQAGQKKDAGDKGPMNPEQKAGESKDKGPQEKSSKPDTGQAKGPGQEKPPTEAGKGKDAKNEPGAQPQEKGSAKEEPKESPGQTKDQGPKTDKDKPAQAKDQKPGPGAEGQSKDQKPGEQGSAPQAKGSKQEAENTSNPRGEAKSAPKENIEQARDKKSEEGKSEAGSAKEAGSGSEQKQAQAKPGEQQPEKSAAKEAGDKGPRTNPQQAQARDTKAPASSGQPKPADPKQACEAGECKDASGNPTKTAQAPKNGGATRGREPTLDEIERLKDQIKKQGPEGDDAAKQLNQAAKEAKDPRVREAAEQALKESGRTAKNETTAGNGQTQDPKKDPAKASDPGDEPSPETGPGGKGIEDDPIARPANRAFSSRGGNLNLEDLKKKMTPDILKKAGFTDKEWQQFQQDARAYEDMLRRQREQAGKVDPQNLRGDAGFLPSTGPRLAQPGTNATVSPTQTSRGLPPPEFREKYFRWTTKAAEKK